MTQKEIFISYSRMDQKRAFALAKKLEGEGLSVWLDQERIDGAVLWQKEIVEAIQNARAVILLASNASFKSVNVTREISLAFEEEKPILPVFLEEAEIPAEFRYQLAGIHRIEIHKTDDKKSWESILNAVRKIMQKSRPVKGRKSVTPAPAPARNGLPIWLKVATGIAMVLVLLVVAKKIKNKNSPVSPAITQKKAPVSQSPVSKPAPPLLKKEEPSKTFAARKLEIQKEVEKSASVMAALGSEDKESKTSIGNAMGEKSPQPPLQGGDSENVSNAPEPPSEPAFVLGRYENGREFFRGRVWYLNERDMEFRMEGLKTGGKCSGKGKTSAIPDTGVCDGMTGTVSFSCDRGIKINGTLKVSECYKGEIVANDQSGKGLKFRYGLSQQQVRKLMERPMIKRLLERQKNRQR